MNSKEGVRVSVIIVNYRTKTLTEDCVRSVCRAMGGLTLRYEIIVVDNGSADGSYEFLCRLSSPNVKVIRSEKNGGFGYGNNLGVRHACGEYLFFLNSDTILYFDVISEMCGLMETMPEVGVMSCLMDDAEHIPLQVAHPYENLKTVFLQTVVKPLMPQRLYRRWRTGRAASNTGRQISEGGWVSGAAMLIPRELFLEAGGWNEDFFMYMEDEELCHRIQRLGRKVVVYQKLGLQHLVGKSGGSAFSAYQRYKSKFLYFRLTCPKGRLLLRPLLYLQARQYMKNLSRDERRKVIEQLKEVEK